MSSRIPLPLSAAWEEIWAKSAEQSGVVGEAHLLLGILDSENEEVAALLMLSGVSREEAQLYAQSWLDNGPATAAQKIEFAISASLVLILASREAQRDKRPFIEPHHFFIACLSQRRGAHLGQVLRPLGLDASELRAHLRRIRASQKPYPRGHPLNDLSEDAKAVLNAAHAEMRASFCGRIAAAHLLLGLLSDARTVDQLEQAGCDVEDLRKRAREGVKSDGEIASLQKRFSPGAKRTLERAARAAKLAGRKRIDCGDLLMGLLPQSETMGEKWWSRGRKLDSVDELWTAEQVEALRGELGNVANDVAGPTVYRQPKSRSILAWVLGAGSSVAATFWAACLIIPPNGDRTTEESVFIVMGLVIFVASGFRVCARLPLRRSSIGKSVSLTIFLGWLLGIVFGVATSVGQ